MRTLLPVAFLLCTSLNAQTTFAPIGAKWTYEQHYAWNSDSSVFIINCIGDTLIEGTSCSVLAYSGGISECMGFRTCISTVGDSVIFWEAADSTFRTLYVFGLSPGEGWETVVARGHWDLGDWVVVYDTLSFQVTAGDTVLIDGNALRRSTVAATWSLDWPHQTVAIGGTITERLGHSIFMFPQIDGACDFEYNGPLRCYEDPEISWLNPQFPQCELSVGLIEALAGWSFGIRPTLVSTGEPIQVNGSQGTIIVLDAVGRVVLQRTIQGLGSFDLDTPGAYIVRFSASEGGSAHQRIVVR